MYELRALGAFAALLALIASAPGRAECPGKPDALGTSRTLVVEPTEHMRLGMMQYSETLPLDDHEVVLTFDDGLLLPYTTRALDILASECVKATYFLVGRMAKAYPNAVRQIHAAGHSIGTHSNSHPFTFHRMTPQQAESEVEGGIAAVAEALGDRNAIAPHPCRAGHAGTREDNDAPFAMVGSKQSHAQTIADTSPERAFEDVLRM